MYVTLLGIIIDVKPVHPQNAPCTYRSSAPMLVTLLGIVTELRFVQP